MTINELMRRYGELPCDCGRVHTTDSERRLCLRAQPGWEETVEGWVGQRAAGDGEAPMQALMGVGARR
jgi:hypothetical protein